jgi:uncharacterized protein YecT (DUF1311 family)
MDEIIKDLWMAVKDLSSSQWVVLIALSIFIGVGLFLIFRWLYQTRFEAQTTLIDLKDKTIEHYKTIHKEQVAIKPLSAIVPEDWKPYLEQPYNLFEEYLNKAEAQQEMNRISADMGFILDANLYILYLRIFYSLPTDQADNFKKEQENWLKKRHKQCEDSVESHGGTLAPLEYGLAFIKFTQIRITELETKYKWTSND